MDKSIEKVTQLYAWIATHQEGNETIISLDMASLGLGNLVMQATSSKLETCKRLEPIVERICKKEKITARIVTFKKI